MQLYEATDVVSTHPPDTRIRIAGAPCIGVQSFNFQLALNQILGPANHSRLFAMVRCSNRYRN